MASFVQLVNDMGTFRQVNRGSVENRLYVRTSDLRRVSGCQRRDGSHALAVADLREVGEVEGPARKAVMYSAAVSAARSSARGCGAVRASRMDSPSL